MASRIILLLSPLLLSVPVALMASGFHAAALLAMFVVSSGVGALVRWHANQNNRDGNLWGMGAFFLPLVTPILLALLPEDPNSGIAQLRTGSGAGRAKAAEGSFEERFPLLTECLAGQPEVTRVGLKARFRAVKTNFEFLLPTSSEEISRLLAEAQDRGFVIWTGISGGVPLVYGAGLVRSSAVDETSRWLSSAGASGQKLAITFRDAEGILRIMEHRFDPAPAP